MFIILYDKIVFLLFFRIYINKNGKEKKCLCTFFFFHNLSILFQNKHKEAKNSWIQKGTQNDNDDNEDKARQRFCEDDAQKKKLKENKNIRAK
jgi:hypothetical protein